MVNICLLGTGGMMPLPNRYLTSLLVALNGKMLLIDCGEGTQVTMKSLGWGFKSLEIICFTHYHADHIAGLPGLLLTLANSGKQEPLTLIGPVGLKKVVEGLLVIAPYLPYEIKYIELDGDEEIEVNGFYINTLTLDHSITCLGYTINIKRLRKFDPIKAEEKQIPKRLWGKLQQGQSVENFTPEMVLGKARKGIKLCYCTDTRPTEGMVEFLESADIFIGEGIYGSDEMLPKAEGYKHMIFSEVAGLAERAKVKELWITHLSPSLNKPEEYLDVAKNIFKNSVVGEDRMTKEINFEE